MKVKVKLTGTDGNVFALLGLCASAMSKAGQVQEAKDLQRRVLSCNSYDEALAAMMEAVDVS